MEHPTNMMAMVAGLYKQAKGEEDAKEEYAEFLACFENKLDKEDRATIREIIGDEVNHAIKLAAMSVKYGKIKPASDDLEKALKVIGKSAGVFDGKKPDHDDNEDFDD